MTVHPEDAPARRPLLSTEDHRLSMRITPRARDAEDNADLRSMIVHRLVEGPKAVLRFGLRRRNTVSVYCEPCDRWTPVKSVTDDWDCPGWREYHTEFVIYSEVPPETDAG